MSDHPGLFNLTAPAVMIFPSLFEPKAIQIAGKPAGEPKYGANFMFGPEHPDLTGLKAAMVAVARAKWPGRDLKGLAFPLANGDKLADQRRERTGKDDREFQRGKVLLKARAKFQPRLSAIINGKLVDLEGPAMASHKSLFFFGAEVLIQVNFATYLGVGNNSDGVTAYLNMVLTTGKGERLGSSRQSAAEAFAGYVGHSTNYDPRGAGYDDEIPF